MWTPLLLIALAASPAALQETPGKTNATARLEYTFWKLEQFEEKIEEATGLWEARDLELHSSCLELGAQVETLKNATSQILEELDVLRSRQAASSAVQAFMALAFLAYLATIAVCYLVKRCRKHQKEIAKAEFEMLETKLQASRSRRRAAAAARTNKQTSQ